MTPEQEAAELAKQEALAAERREAFEILTRANPSRPDLVQMYLDQFAAYREASRNIAERGNITADPKTGRPIMNPYRSVLSDARRAMAAMKQVRAARLWERFGEAPAPPKRKKTSTKP